VAVRVRPLLPREVLRNHRVCVRPVPDMCAVVVGADRTFPFDQVFGGDCGHDELYAACVRPLVEALLRGHNATVFAYGQTGSGKTYTLGGGLVGMEGSQDKLNFSEFINPLSLMSPPLSSR